MKNEIPNNPVFVERMKYWEATNPAIEAFFKNKGIALLLKAIELYLQVKPAPRNELVEVIDSLVETFNSLNTKQYKPKQGKKNPKLLDKFLFYIKNDYTKHLINEEISGERSLNINGVTVPISENEIKRFIKKDNKTPLTRENIADIEKDFIETTKKRYTKSSSRKVEFRGYQSNLNDKQIKLLFNELINKYIDSKTTFSDFSLLFKDDILPNDYNIKWKKSNVLLAYLTKKLFYQDNYLNLWEKARMIFKVDNLAQSETNNPHPKGHIEIDQILKNIYTHLG